MRQYSTHKRFIKDIVRFTDSEMVSEASSYFILLRSCSAMEDVSDEQISWVVDKIVNTNLSNIYSRLYDDIGLSTQEITFRIKRVKYIVNKNDDLKFKFPNVLSEIAETFKNTIVIPYIEVKRMTKEDEIEKVEKVEKEKVARKEKTEQTLKWILENVSWKSRDGVENKGKMSASQASKELNLSAMRIRGMLRNYYKTHSPDAPLDELEPMEPENKEQE